MIEGIPFELYQKETHIEVYVLEWELFTSTFLATLQMISYPFNCKLLSVCTPHDKLEGWSLYTDTTYHAAATASASPSAS